MFAFAGPAYLVSVGYMDPGNWATDLEGGARFGYALIWVLLMSNLMAVLLQTLSARLGVVTGRDLAQACRDNYNRAVSFVLWIFCEVAIAACDLAELLGTTIGLHLLFGIPLEAGVFITAFDTLLLLALQRLGIRKVEAFILGLVSIIGLCFLYEVFLAKPDMGQLAGGFIPSITDLHALYIAIGILGATVMPHNLYLHSALVQTREYGVDHGGKRAACRFNFFDSVVALNAAFFVNAAILVVAAAVFWRNGIMVTEIQQAHQMLAPLLGSRGASIAFGVALLAAGQASTLTGTMAGQVVMEGFLHIRLRPWIRRLTTRAVAIVPAAIVIWVRGSEGTTDLLIFSQVVLSFQLPFAIVPLLHFTSSRRAMGFFANRWWVKVLAWAVATVIIALNGWLAWSEVAGWLAGPHGMVIGLFVLPLVGGVVVLLGWLMLAPLVKRWRVRPAPQAARMDADRALGGRLPAYGRIAVALNNGEVDRKIIGHALPLVRAHHADILLVHVVEGPTSDLYGDLSHSAEARRDQDYLDELADRLRAEGLTVHVLLGHGKPSEQIIDLLSENRADLLVMGTHGHKRLMDLLFGQTIDRVRHGLDIPVFTVR
ncbi:MAG: Divalent metal cation transporter MntH [Phycisphaerae bacterium]|nr:Divalent metal cation transporter MntH [Phycisphaerae bacterium]